MLYYGLHDVLGQLRIRLPTYVRTYVCAYVGMVRMVDPVHEFPFFDMLQCTYVTVR